MNKLLATLAVAGLVAAMPAAASHINYLGIPFADRGECESTRQMLSNEDDFLLDQFPQLFSSPGEVRSFLNRAFTCERSLSDDQWYIIDHRREVLGSDWFQRRL